MADKIKVFQDMSLRGPASKRSELRGALIAATVDPWLVDIERSAELARGATTSQDVVLFKRVAGTGYPAAGLTLWETDEGYYVPNIVPLEYGQLTIAQYNAILVDFVERVVEPIAAKFGFTVTTTEPRQGLDNWLSPDAAIKLRRFSGAANKSTGASHPSDERRWFDFVVAVHRTGDQLGSDRLVRWLHEAEGWDDDSAHRLAGNFEKSLALLAYYDQH